MLTPSMIAGYELRHKIRHSPSGTVFRAYHPEMDRYALVKLQPKAAASSREVLRRFQREIQLTASLCHPQLLWALHAGVEAGWFYLVLEDVDGVDLQTLVTRDGPLPVERAIDLILQAARGLAFLHAHGIVHRNVKPASLLVDQRGGLRVANLTAALLEGEGGDDPNDQLTRQGHMVGSADYLPPEQAFDPHTADARSDVYGLGCTLHFLITGSPPYAHARGHRAATAHAMLPTPSMRVKRPEISAELDAVFQSMLAKMPVDRPATMDEAARRIERAHQGLAPDHGSWLENVKRWSTIAAAIALGLGIGGAGMAAFQLWAH
ncbi:MAG: serine/threonine-protein kinase [Pirellulales bacterium]|jgi:serine/threonine protein kinase